MSELKAYTAEKIFTGDQWLEKCAVVIEKDIIRDIIPQSSLPENIYKKEFSNCIIAPAFIDLQIYGAYGKLLAVYSEADSLHKLNDYCRMGGAAYCLPTVATNKKEIFFKCIDAVRNYWNESGEGILGLHLEGPWISREKRGAHIELLIHSPTIEEVKELLAYGKDVIKMITLASEVCSVEVIDFILSHNIIISAGHSNATYKEAMHGFQNGITAATHLYNAMSELKHRKPGMVGAIFDHDKVMASIIPDGNHVDYAAIRIAKKIMGERLFVITDAVTDTREGFYHHQLAGDKYEAAGVLSGSALTMNKALRNLVNHAGIGLDEALRMCSLYPARVLKKENELGKIEKGYSAHIVVMNELFEMKQII